MVFAVVFAHRIEYLGIDKIVVVLLYREYTANNFKHCDSNLLLLSATTPFCFDALHNNLKTWKIRLSIH